MISSSEVKIYCSTKTPRLEYISDFLCASVGITFTVNPIQDKMPENAGVYCIHYSRDPISGACNIYDGGLLIERGIRPIEPEVVKQDQQFLIFPAPGGFDMTFDLFAALFFMLTRYEEYLPYVPDRYGRFEAGQSLAYQHGFIEEPVVDQWLNLLKTSLKKKFPALGIPPGKFRFVPTLDIDHPWAYLHKGLWRSTGSILKDILHLKFHELQEHLDVITGQSPDPYDVYSYVQQLEERYGYRSAFFFLSGGYGRYDVNYSLHSRPFKSLLQQLGIEREIGIHPSFRSNRNQDLLRSEFVRFSTILGRKPQFSRQHFLMIRMPETYRNLIALGIQGDYSMGFASSAGFRAGTTLPFRFYDLPEEKGTDLLIHPFVVMDVTLKQYLNLNANEASGKIKTLIDKVRSVKGTFTFLWHNESLSEQKEWRGWRKVFELMWSEGVKQEQSSE